MRKIVYYNDGVYKVYLRSSPENSRANKELVKYLSKSLDVPVRQVRIVSGKKSRMKTVAIDGVHEVDFKKIVEE